MKNAQDNRFVKLIRQGIDENPIEKLGLTWASLSNRQVADRLALSESTVKRLIKDPRIMTITIVIDGKRVRLVRLDDGENSTEFDLVRDQRIMKQKYVKMLDDAGREKIRQLRKREYGVLMDLCSYWPRSARIKIFRHFMNRRNWSAFMAVYKNVCIAEDGLAKPDGIPIRNPNFTGKFYKHPNILVLADGKDIAKELWEDHQDWLKYKAITQN